MATLTGKVIGGYEILEEVGRGAMGVVFKARQVSMDRVVALKFLPKSMAQKPNLVQRFMREARAAGKLSHPNIVAVHDVGQLEGLYFISMEFIDGTTAHKKMKDQGKLPEAEAVGIGLQIASALKEAHARGVLHRDVKPDNFLIDKEGRARLADLGLARSTNNDDSDDAHLTQAGSALGTPHYMSPEQARGKEADTRSDLYCLGASLYTLSTGKTMFEGATPASVMALVIAEPHKPLRQMNADLSPGFCAVVEKLVQKDPAKRYQTAQEAFDALEKVRAGEKIPGSETTGRRTPVGAARRVREREPQAGAPKAAPSPMLYAGIGVGAALLLLVSVFALKGGGSDSQQAAANKASDAKSVQSAEPKPSPAAIPAALSPEDLAAAQKQQEADRAYQDLLKRHEASLTSDPAGLAGAWDGFIKSYPQAKQLDSAKAKGAEARTSAENLKKEWDGVRAESDTLAGEQKFKEAYDKLAGFVEAHATSPYAADAKKKIDVLKETVIAKLREYIGRAVGVAESGDIPAARKSLDDLAAKTPSALTEAAGLKQAYEKLDGLDSAAKSKAEAADAADRKILEEAHKKAEGLVRGAETRFQFADAVKIFREAASKASAAGTKVSAGAWAERYDRAGKYWAAAKAAVTSGKKPEVAGMASFPKGNATGWSDKGIQFTPAGYPEQLITWKIMTPRQALNLAMSASPERGPLEAGLFAYTVGLWNETVEYLGKVEGADKSLAEEPRERALSMLEDDAKTAFAAGKAAYEKKDAVAVQKELKPLAPPGLLAETKTAKENAAEIKKMLQDDFAVAAVKKDEPAKAADGKDASEDLKKAGWDSVDGEWKAVSGKTGVFAVKDGKLKVDIKEGTVSVTVQAKTGAVVEVYIRADEGGIEKAKGGIGLLRFSNAAFADKLQAALKDSAEGYGVKIEGGKARIYEAGPMEALAEDAPADRGGKGPGGRGRGGGGQGFWQRVLGEAPAKGQEFDLQGDTYKIAVSAVNTKLDVQVNDKAHSHNHRMRDEGVLMIKIIGEATVTTPVFKKQ